MYCIIKEIPSVNGKIIPAALLTSGEEILELEEKEALELAELLTVNSNNGYVYTAKRVG